MIYPYRCLSKDDCGATFEVIKSVAEIDRPEVCRTCGGAAERYIARTHFYGAGDWNNQTFNHGLGCVTKSNAEARKIAKARGLEEVGTEKLESIHSQAEKTRDERRKAIWDDDRVKTYD